MIDGGWRVHFVVDWSIHCKSHLCSVSYLFIVEDVELADMDRQVEFVQEVEFE